MQWEGQRPYGDTPQLRPEGQHTFPEEWSSGGRNGIYIYIWCTCGDIVIVIMVLLPAQLVDVHGVRFLTCHGQIRLVKVTDQDGGVSSTCTCSMRSQGSGKPRVQLLH